VGQLAEQAVLAVVFTVGDKAALISQEAKGGVGDAANFPTQSDCAAHLRAWLKEGDAVLLKGSRSAGMERVLSELESS